MENQTLMQYFEWYLPNDGQHWNRLAKDAPHLASKGIRKVWMPPAFKATSSNDVGYGIYDLFDLGEFDQKGTIRTKYGLKEEYLKAIKSLKENGIEPIADIVLNHKAAADYKERFTVIEVDPNDRTVALSEPFEIKGWTKFTFPGRHKNTMILSGIGITLLGLIMMLNGINQGFISFKETTKGGQMMT